MSEKDSEVERSSAREWTETATYILASIVATYALCHQAGLEVNWKKAVTQVETSKKAIVKSFCEKYPWFVPKLWRKMTCEVLIEAWRAVEEK